MRKKLKLVLLLIVLGVVSSIILVNVNNTKNTKETKEVEVIEAEDIDIEEKEKNIEEEKEPIESAPNSDETKKEEKTEVKEEEPKEEKVESVVVKEEPKEEVKESSNLVSLGKFKLTAYCPCSKCCGKSDGITASGTKATQGRTVACNSLPIGTKIRINGHDYIVEDRGTSHIDIFFSSHSEALNFGVRYAEVFKVN